MSPDIRKALNSWLCVRCLRHNVAFGDMSLHRNQRSSAALFGARDPHVRPCTFRFLRAARLAARSTCPSLQGFLGQPLSRLFRTALILFAILGFAPAQAYVLVVDTGPSFESHSGEAVWESLKSAIRESGFAKESDIIVLKSAGFRHKSASDAHDEFMNQIAAVLRKKAKPSYVLWRGDLGATSFEEYRDRFNNTARAMRQLGVSAPFIVAVGTECGSYPAEVENAPFALQGPLTKVFLGPDFRNSKARSCSQAQQMNSDIAKMWLTAIRDADYKYAKIRRETLLFLFD